MSAGACGHSWRPAPPPVLDAILARVEILQRRLARIRPCRPGAIIGVVQRPHRGGARVLDDGTQVANGDPIGDLHLDPSRVRELHAQGGYAAVLRQVRGDLAALARWADRQPSGTRPVAYRAEGIIVPVTRRLGFEVRPSRRTPWTLVREWHFRWLLAHWSPAGRDRLRKGRTPLRLVEAWLSAASLRARQGAPHGPG